MKGKRILALIGVILLVSMILLLVISPFISTELFMASLFSAVTIPIMIYGYILVYRLIHKNDKEKDNK
ncbi:MAG: hypothetical protein K0S47_2092 [Herbinix sp.]|jgi:accessory gene regulator protein AgrB|nr:hypothetical protein [Herbinix sp.]